MFFEIEFDTKNVFHIEKPSEVYLPQINLSSSYVFASVDYFFAARIHQHDHRFVTCPRPPALEYPTALCASPAADVFANL